MSLCLSRSSPCDSSCRGVHCWLVHDIVSRGAFEFRSEERMRHEGEGRDRLTARR